MREKLQTIGVRYDEVLKRFMGKEDFYLRMLRKFLDDKNYGELRKAVDEKRWGIITMLRGFTPDIRRMTRARQRSITSWGCAGWR